MVNKSLHSSYIEIKLNNRNKMIINIFSVYVVPLLKYINHPELLQVWKLNLDDASYGNNIDSNMSKPSDKNKCIVMIAACTGQPQ